MAGNKRKSLFPLIFCFGYANGLGGGGHGIRLIILMAMGLAGMFMLHMLAQDFNKIHGAITNAGKLFNIRAKRDNSGHWNRNGTLPFSINQDSITKDINFTLPEINWAKILTRDPTGCARSLVCQLATIPENKWGREEINILTMVELTTMKKNWANQEMKSAYKLGKTLGYQNKQVCYEKYNLCPYSSTTMLAMLRFFGAMKG